MAPAVRLLPFADADGPANMAADQALLESAAAGVASLRFYGWTAPTLSLGYFQPAALRHADPRLAALPWVRRPSGGEALVHHHELTYAFALPPGPAWQPRDAPWPARMHAALTAALAALGVRVRPCGPEEERQRGEVLCFLHHTPGDLLIGESKVVGSAQRRQRGALLQHGSVLLARSPHTPALPGVAELTGVRLTPAELAGAAASAWVRDTGWALAPGGWTDAERRRVEELAAARYAAPAWNAKR